MPEFKKNIIWIASYPKSGNTWFRIFLSNLLSDTIMLDNFNNLFETPISSSRKLIDHYLGTHSSDLSNEEIENLRPQIYKKISFEHNDTIYLKTHDAWIKNDQAMPLFPTEVTKGVVYIIRNPLDIVISYSHHFNVSTNQAITDLNNSSHKLCSNSSRLENQVQQYLYSWSDHVRSWVENSQVPVHVMRFEDMLENPTKTFWEALDFLHLKYSASKISRAIKNSSFDYLKTIEKAEGFRERSIHSDSFFRKGNSNEWKLILNHAHVNDIINHHSDIMERFNYL